MSLAIIVAASLLAAPERPQTEASLKDVYPSWALRSGKSAAAYQVVLVDPKGRVVRCETRAFEGSERLAREMCASTKDIRYIPARRSDGTPTYGQIVGLVRLVQPGTVQGDLVARTVDQPEAELTVASLPEGDGGRKTVKVAVEVDTQGLIGACAGSADADSAYADAACRTLRDTPPGIVRDDAGVAVSYVRQMTVDFVVAP